MLASAAARRWVLHRPATLSSDLRCLGKIAGPPSSRSRLALARWWRRPADHRILTLPEPSGFYCCSWASRHRQFGTASQQPQQSARKQHLYLVLDDQPKEYSIYKLDMDSDHLDEGGHSSLESPLSLPEPPFLCLGPQTLDTRFAALGSHIIATGDAATLTYDTKTDLSAVSEVCPEQLDAGYRTAIAARNKLYVLESYTCNSSTEDKGEWEYWPGGLHCLAIDPSNDERDWTWQPLSRTSRFSWSKTSDPPEFPFNVEDITAHAVHPRTGTILVSVYGTVCGTFSYGTGGRGQWKRRGLWVFPFVGKAHYDRVLGAWVGLHVHPPHCERGVWVGHNFYPVRAIRSDGYVSACPVMSGWQSPKWKVGGEKLFIEHPHWTYEDAKLVPMGENSKYCLVERLVSEGEDEKKRVLRLTVFIVKYGKEGELQTMVHQPSRFYKAPNYESQFDVQAFSM